MKIIGITGGIACGKSTLSNTLRKLGAAVWDADAASRALTAPGGRALPAIRRAFGDGVFFPEGHLDRRALGAVIFEDEDARRQLNAILHPMVFEDMEAFLRAHEGEQAVFLDVPLLYETGCDRRCHEVWCAFVPHRVQLQRLMARDGLTKEEAAARIQSQMPLEEKARRADRLIDTSGSIEESAAQLIALYRQAILSEGAHT